MRVVPWLRNVWIVCVASWLALAACSNTSQSVRSEKASYVDGPVMQESGGGSPPSPAADRVPGVARAEEAAKKAADRPGLGTEFGESRYSPVTDTPFERSSREPWFLGTIHYNDGQGAQAQQVHLHRRYVAGEPMWRTYSNGRPSAWSGISISIVDENGVPLPAYHLPNHVLVVGTAGQRYAIQVENRTGQRFELVASVDGQDVIDGRSASLGKRGYLIDGHQRIRIEGFRTSMSEVAAFRFGSVRNSYAARTSEFGDRNVGVIGVALFGERGAPMPDLEDEARRRHEADPFPGRFSSPP